MQASSTVFSQITSVLYPTEFSRCVQQFPTRRATRGFTAYDQFLCLCFGQLTYRESLRDVVSCLRAKRTLHYHLGLRGHITRTNFAYANRHRDWRLFRALAQILMRRASGLYATTPSDPDWPQAAYALDSSIISLSLNLFPWGFYARSQQAAVKLHLLLSLQGNLPAWAAITDAHFQDMKILDRVPKIPGAYYIMDRGYLDFTRLFDLHQSGTYFVIRNKRHVKFRVLRSHPVNKQIGLRCDQRIRLVSPWSVNSYPEPLRRIRLYDPENQLTLILLTNQFDLPAELIAQLYKKRWQVELFFKWVKQHLRIRGFYGRTPNAVYSQIWAAICAYLMVAIVKKRLQIQKTMYEILQIVSVNIFEQVPLEELLTETLPPPHHSDTNDDAQNLLPLNNI